MNSDALIASLERFAGVLPAVVAGVSDADARWRPDDGAWSILEIVTHMADEEGEDFRTRVEHTLRDPAASWPPIAPEEWAVERAYNDGDLDATIARFVRERKASVAWLRGLADPDWAASHRHPKGWVLRAGDVLAAWTAHDALHLRQIAKRLYQIVRRDAGDYVVDYAGAWGS
jgi:hypothetical protein